MAQSPLHYSRPISYSESHMHIPRVASNLKPLILEDIQASPPPSPTKPHMEPLEFETEVPSSPTQRYSACKRRIQFGHRWAVRFSFHLMLISMFETLFFWHVISTSEDSALVDLINTYSGKVTNVCMNMTTDQRNITHDLVIYLFNRTEIDAAGALAAAGRDNFNTGLQKNSWLYFAGVAGLFTTLAAATRVPVIRQRIKWGKLVGENLALVTLLGLYELMFFKTVIFPYRAVSVPELDRMVSDELNMFC